LYTFKNENKKTQYDQVKLPSINYGWMVIEEIPKKKLAIVNNSGLLECMDLLGKFSVDVHDTRGVINKVQTEVRIIEPFSIDVQIREVESTKNHSNYWEVGKPFFGKFEEDVFENKWSLIVGRNYHLRANINDVSSNKITLSDNTKFEWSLPKGVTLVKEQKHEIIIRTDEISHGTNREIQAFL